MKKIGLLCLTLLLCCTGYGQTMSYTIDPTKNMDTFLVTLDLDKKLDRSAGIFQFASTAPGTYQTMNIGRFVSDFKALDRNGRALEVTRLNVNQFEIKKPEKVTQLTYRVAETFDTPVSEYPIYTMCGTSIEADHTLINTHAILGYFYGYQQSPLTIQLITPENWKIGTALEFANGQYLADDFDQQVGHQFASPAFAAPIHASQHPRASARTRPI